ncbi:MAG: hypothetical protein P8012_17900 [Desulfobacterales bacterium]
MSEQQRKEIDLQAQKLVIEKSMDETSDFRNFVLDYEGRAKDMPKFIQILRGSVRPVLTYFFGAVSLFIFMKSTAFPDQLFKLDLIVLGFWFGERATRKIINTQQGNDTEK